jgi:hypothetical protein
MGDKRAAVDVAAVEARAAKATKAPWTVHRFDKSGGAINYQVQQDGNEGDVISNVRDDDVKQAKGTALFIAASRTDVPALCAALREQDEELAALRAELVRESAISTRQGVALRSAQSAGHRLSVDLCVLRCAALKVSRPTWRHAAECEHRDCPLRGSCSDGNSGDDCDAPGKPCACYVADVEALVGLARGTATKEEG